MIADRDSIVVGKQYLIVYLDTFVVATFVKHDLATSSVLVVEDGDIARYAIEWFTRHATEITKTSKGWWRKVTS